jgi:uncharacterized membrane protein
MQEFFGRFHPVLVHLPIGILLMACLFLLLTLKPRFVNLKPAIPLLLLLGALSAIASAISGYLLADSGDYAPALVTEHQWFGISVAVLSVLLYFVNRRAITSKIPAVVAAILIVLITITGHLGGALTHGADYLTAPLNGAQKSPIAIPPIPNIQEALVYKDAVQPLLQNRCYNCHGSEKQKGKLRLDLQAYILKGGKNGKTVLPGNAEESELLKRLLLPASNENHMPPAEKPQLTDNEIALLHWWIASGASFDKKVKDIIQPAEIKPVLATLQQGEKITAKAPELPTAKVSQLGDATLKQLAAANITVVPVEKDSHFISANFVNAVTTPDSIVLLLDAMKAQLIALKLERNDFNDATLRGLKNCKNLMRLSLNNSGVTDAGLVNLQGLTQLRYLSLTNTKVTARGVKALPGLKEVFLYNTLVTPADLPGLQKALPGCAIDLGGYKVPTTVADTTEVKDVLKPKG